MVWKNLGRRKARTTPTPGGIAIGIGVVVALSALSAGMVNQITGRVMDGGADLPLMQAGVADMSFSALDEQTGAAIAAMPEVGWVSSLLLNF